MTLAAIPNKNIQIRRYPLKSAQTTVQGDGVYLDTNGDVLICGADPATIAGFQMHDYNSNLDVDIYSSEVLVALAYSGSTFILEATSAPTNANEGIAYGGVFTSGANTIDLTDTTNTCYILERAITDWSDWNAGEVSVELDTRQFQA